MKRWQIVLIASFITVAFFVVDGGATYIRQLMNRPPKAAFTYRTPTRTLKYIAPTDRDTIIFLNNSTDLDGDTLISQWYVRYNGTGEWKLLNVSRDHWGRLPASNEKGHEIKLAVSDGAKEDSVAAILPVDPALLLQYPDRKVRFPIKGVCYQVGVRQWAGGFPSISEEEMRECLSVILELNCNALRIYGNIDENILKCAEIAVELGFKVIGLSPRYIDCTRKETLARFAKFAKESAYLTKRSPNILMIVGNELTLDSREWVDLPTYNERANKPDERRKNPERINDFLSDLIACIPTDFAGKITYARGSWEKVEWNDPRFDIVSSNEYYWHEQSEENYLSILRTLRQFGRPLYMTEFGAATFEGAFGIGGTGSGQAQGKKYSQDAQATYINQYLTWFDRANVDGCFLYHFNDKGPDPTAYTGLTEGGRRKKSFYLYKSCIPTLLS